MNRTQIRAAALAAVLCWGSALGEVKTGRFENRDAWVLDNGKLRVSIVQSGGHIGEITLAGQDAVNPLWIQSRPTIDPEQFEPSKHQSVYGPGSVARLMAGLLGHNLCFPFWGDPSPTEAAAGMSFHGEAGIVRWRQTGSGPDSLTVTAQLNESGTSLTRTIRLRGQIAEVEETARNEKAWDRPVGWCQHVTIGPPFLERTVTQIAASLTRGRTAGKTDEFQWPSGRAEQTIDLSSVRKLPKPSGFVNNFLVDPAGEYGFFTAFHPKYRIVFGYVFPRAQYPWLNIWESNTPEMLTRGMEFSNTPVHGTFKALMKTPKLWGVPTFEWLDAKSEMKKQFWAFSIRVPEGFKGVARVAMRDGRIEITERSTSQRHLVPPE